MKLTVFTILALCIIAVCRSAEEEYDYEEEVVAVPVTPAPTKPTGGRLSGLLSARGRANVGNIGKKRPPPIAQSTTAKPVESVPEEETNGEAVLEENQEQEAPTTTTESAKKFRSGGVRPFRSNEDLLAALKRRRAQNVSNSPSRETTTTHSSTEHTTTTKPKGNANSRNKSNETKTPGRSRFGGRGNKAVHEEVEETQREEIQVKPKSSSYRRG